MKTRLHEEQRQSCTISSFFLRVPRRVSESAAAVRAGVGLLGRERDAGDARNCDHMLVCGMLYPTMMLTKIENAGERESTHFGNVARAFSARRCSRIWEVGGSVRGAVDR